jgi:RimJ/RimL family protein N-acetyltransferase
VTDWLITPLRAADRPAWNDLFRGYLEFYEEPATAEHFDTIWSWLTDPDHPLAAIVARPGIDAEPVGLAHYRPYPRPLHATVGCYLDDLFVAPEARGTGAVDALLRRLRELCTERGWEGVRWITREGNARARAVYERLAQRTALITYEMPPLS